MTYALIYCDVFTPCMEPSLRNIPDWATGEFGDAEKLRVMNIKALQSRYGSHWEHYHWCCVPAQDADFLFLSHSWACSAVTAEELISRISMPQD